MARPRRSTPANSNHSRSAATVGLSTGSGTASSAARVFDTERRWPRNGSGSSLLGPERRRVVARGQLSSNPLGRALRVAGASGQIRKRRKTHLSSAVEPGSRETPATRLQIGERRSGLKEAKGAGDDPL